ncbi:MAG: hypothetical protein HKM02_03385 [Pseudomonadales bacterium]|nr:hypothetical protein [Pseudomonadales bacterium]
MFKKEIAHDRSRLGELLINKGLITRQQLDKALQRQHDTGLKLGEVLLELDWISDRQLNRALARQKSYRFAIAFAAAVSAPLTPMMAAAATVDDPAAAAVINAARGSMRSLDDESMAGVSGQAGINIQQAMSSMVQGPQQVDNSNQASPSITSNQVAMVNSGGVNQLMASLKPDASNNAVDMLINSVKSVLPVQADIQIKGVSYAATTSGHGSKSNNSSSKGSTDALQALLPLQTDGSGVTMDVAVPTHIDSILISNIQVAGAAAGSPVMGDMALVGIDFHNTNVKVTLR